MKPRILFILKRREDYSAKLHSEIGLSTGLYNSAKFVSDMLVESGVDSAVSVAVDSNCIDRIVTEHRPTHVIVEALWVTPSKFYELTNLHPSIKWIVRLHSEMPFIAGEGIAVDWIGDYLRFTNITVAANAPRMYSEVRHLARLKGKGDVAYLPNYYPVGNETRLQQQSEEHVDVGCFGAVRLLKNHLVQAFGALKFADRIGKSLNFHINSGRVEMQGDPVLRNLQGLFSQLESTGHKLINHVWTPREEFLTLCSKMDVGLQVSFSETFNIVGADFIGQGVPIVGSPEIPWSSKLFNADPTNSDKIADAIGYAYKHSTLNVWLNRKRLTKYVASSKETWLNYFKE